MRSLYALTGAVGAMLAGGCATAPLTAAGYDGDRICNAARMQQTESAARRVGSRVLWVNCPSTTIRVPQPPERSIS